MKIALLSDIHANLPALEACLKEIDKHTPDAVYCLGDLVGYNTWPNEVVNLIRKRNIPTIAGNYDHGIGLGIDECGCAYKTEEEITNGKMSIRYTNDSIGESERNYLKALPAHIRLEYKNEGRNVELLLVHGSPRKNNEYLFEDREEESFLRIFEQANADILCFGHTHKPFHRVFKTASGYKHAINTGSVGKPKDGDPRGCFVMITIDPDKTIQMQDFIKVEFIRFNYEIEKAVRAIEESILPNTFATALRTGR